jgi:tRNA dimethylallyltransferase
LSIYFIVGPTAIGKSDLALRIAQHINGEIINADSMQVYKNLNILTARPQKQDLKKIKHHLYGHIEGFNRYNVAHWCNESLKIIKKNNNKKPLIFVGGTGMYIDKLINGLFNIPTIPEKLKKQSEKELNKLGINKFYEEVIKVDKEATIKINSNDSIRLRRIWEIFMHTKIPMSTWTKKNEKKFIQNDDYYLYKFLPNREKNYARVKKRFVKMVESGAINEVESY